MTIYNASLAKKGGLKSAMGNLFEPLLLFTSLRACGLKFVTEELYDSAKIPCFVLDVNEGRQSDAQIKVAQLEADNQQFQQKLAAESKKANDDLAIKLTELELKAGQDLNSQVKDNVLVFDPTIGDFTQEAK